MPKSRPPSSSDPKALSLRQLGALHPHPERVTASQFQHDVFFDPRDLVQVKYEMLRSVRTQGQSVQQAAASFGFSRPVFYQALAAFTAHGLVGLLPRKRGPLGGHKLTPEVLAFAQKLQDKDQDLGPDALVHKIRDRFSVDVHPRSVERALDRQKKKLR